MCLALMLYLKWIVNFCTLEFGMIGVKREARFSVLFTFERVLLYATVVYDQANESIHCSKTMTHCCVVFVLVFRIFS